MNQLIRNVIELLLYYSCTLIFFVYTVSAKFVYDTDIHAFDNPTEETEEFIDAVALFFSSLGRLFIEPPLFKLYKNKLYRDFSKSFKVRLTVLCNVKLKTTLLTSPCILTKN